MTARARLAATSRILGVSFACLVLIAARAVGATGERTVSGVRISLGEEGRRWTLIPTMLEGKVESFVALREEIPFGENLTAVCCIGERQRVLHRTDRLRLVLLGEGQ